MTSSKLKKSGHGGTHIPYSTMQNLLVAFVRSYAANKRHMRNVLNCCLALGRSPPRFSSSLNVRDELFDALQKLEGVCRTEDIGKVAQAIEDLCANSEWSRELDK